MPVAELLADLERHVLLAGAGLLLALCIALPAGTLSAFRPRWSGLVLGMSNVGRVIPSLALLTLAYPFFGFGFKSAVIALTALAIPPIAINTDLAFRSVPRAARDAALGLGMTFEQRLLRVESPLAAPVILAGVRTAATELIASATLAAFIGAGGLGQVILQGLQANQPQVLLTGAAAVAALAIAVEGIFIITLRALGDRRQ